MGLKVADLYGELDLKSEGFDRGIGGIKGKLGAIGQRLATAGVAAGAALAAGIYKSVMAASDLNESLSKAKTVFGGYFGEVDKFAQGAAESMGMTRQAALEGAGTFGNLFTALKIGKGPAADMSTSLLQLAGDLASFNNVDPAEALEALRSGLVGETEPMRRFGVNMNDATLKQQAFKMGLIKSVNEGLSPAAKAQAAYALIMAQTKTAQGDFERTSGGLANQMRILKAEMGNTAASVGSVFLPVAVKAVQGLRKLGGFVAPAFDAVKGWITKNGPGITAGIGKAFSGIGKEMAPAFDSIKQSLGKLWAILGPVLAKVASQIGPVLGQVFKALKPVLVEFVNTIAKVIGYVVKFAQFIKSHWAGISTVVVPIFNIIKTVVTTTFKVIVDIVRVAMALVRGDWSGAWKGVQRIVQTIGRGIITVVQNLGRLVVAILRAAWSALKSVASAAWNGLVSVVSSAVGRVIGFVQSIPGRILSALGSLGSLLYNAGASIISGLIQGIKDRLSELWNTVSSIAGKIKDLKGPITKDRTLLRPEGQAIIGGLMDGIADQLGPLYAQVGGIASKISVNAAPQISLAMAGGAAGAAGAGGVQVVEVPIFLDSDLIYSRTLDLSDQTEARHRRGEA